MSVTGRTKAKSGGRGHYVMDLYYADASERDGFRREVLRIDAATDEAAMEEADRADRWRTSSFYRIRAIRSSSRSGDALIYDSQAAAEAPADSVIAIAGNPDVQPALDPQASVSGDEADDAVRTALQTEAMT